MRKLRLFKLLLALILFAGWQSSFGQVFITEIADPNNNAEARYIELYNIGSTAVDFTEGSGWRIDKYVNGAQPSTQSLTLTGTIPANGFYIIAYDNTNGTFNSVYGFAPDQLDALLNGVAGSNGDDPLELVDGTGAVVDQFGVPGTDGSSTSAEYEDGRAERVATVLTGQATYIDANWNTWSDGPGGDIVLTHDAPGDFDPGVWIGPVADTDPPVPTFSPLDAATDVAIDVNPTITFDEAIYSSPGAVVVDDSNVESLITFTDGVNPVAFTATITSNVITVVPDAALLNEQAYTLEVAIVEDVLTNAMDAAASATFTTIAATAETIELTGDYTGPYYAGDEVTVTWTAANFDDVVVEAWVPSENAGAGGWVVMVATTPAVDGTATFTVPVDAEFSADYKLRVADVVDGDPAAETATFEVIPVVTVSQIQSEADVDGNSLYVGDKVKTGGVVSAVKSTSSFFFQSGLGANTGINVYKSSHGLALGDSIIIVGVVGEYFNMTQLSSIVEITNVGNFTPWDATTIATGDMAEMYEGVLVKFENAEVTDNAQGYGEILINDGSGDVKLDDAIFAYDLPDNGRILASVVGPVDFSYSEYKILPRTAEDFVLLNNDATLATFTLGGLDALALTDVVVADPLADAGATLFVETLVDFVGIEAIATDAAAATVEVKLNDVVVEEANFATQVLDAEDVVVVTVTAEDGTIAYYKVTVMGDNRELTLTSPTDAVSLNTGEDLVVTWTSANIANVNIYAVDPTAKETVDLINEEGPIDATLGTYTKVIDNGVSGEYFIRITDATDDTFFDETVNSVTVVDTQAPAGVVFSPEFAAVNVLRNFTLSIEFDEDVVAGTGNLTIHNAADDAVVVTVAETDITVVDNVITTDVEGLTYETEYYVLIDAGMVEDMSGNPVAAVSDITTWTFTTMVAPEMDLFFSEYIEGSSNNKAIEIFNPMEQAVDLSAYEVRLFGNGSVDATQTEALTGTLAPGEVFIIANASADAAISDIADVSSAVTYYNGDDALGLFKNDVLIDVFGTIGSDPGSTWPVAGVADATAEHTLVRKGSVIMGNTDWAASAGTDANSSEWIVFPQNTYDYLGFHIAGLSTEADILTFTLDSQLEPAVIDATAATVDIEVLYGTNIASLTPSVTISLGATIDPAGGSTLDFTNPVEYTVTAEDGSTKLWTVTVTEGAMSDKAEILTFVVDEAVGEAVINTVDATVDITVAVGTDVSAITPSITISLGATIDPNGGTVQDFTNPVVYTVTAQDGTTTKDWTVTITESQIIPIYDIQYTDHPSGGSPLEGEVVTTQGVVTAIHYNYEGGSLRGFFIQDGVGEYNGLYVYNSQLAETVAVGDEVIITGLIEEYYTLTELTSGGGTVDMIIETVSSDNEIPAPVVLTTAVAATEPYEGVLVTVENAEYTIEVDNFGVLGIDDGSGEVYLDDDMHAFELALGSSYNVTGIGHFSYDLPKILPRFAEDIELVSSVKPMWGESIATYPNPFTSTIWIDNAENASRVVVVNLIGQQVMNVNLGGESRTSIQTDNLPSGVYLVTIVNNQGQRTVRKMIKK